MAMPEVACPTGPVVVRLGGLPAEALESFASPVCLELAKSQQELEAALADARCKVVEAIHASLTRFDSQARRLLLAVKRQAFNGRSIGKYQARENWECVLEAAPRVAEQVVLLERERALCLLMFEERHDFELGCERRALLALVSNRAFLRGIALGRPGLVSKIRRRMPKLEDPWMSCEPAKWEQSLLRFATRAAAKLSANSTLTPSILGKVGPPNLRSGWRFSTKERREVSLVRLNRPSLEQLQSLLMRHSAVRARSLVAWNETLEEIADGRFCFVREGRWELEPGRQSFQITDAVRITLDLCGTLVSSARKVLHHGAVLYNELLNDLRDQAQVNSRGRKTEIGRSLARMVEIGALVLMPPWPAHEPRQETRLAELLRGLRHIPPLRAISELLDELLELEESFASASCPESAVHQMQEVWQRLVRSAGQLAGAECAVEAPAHFFEDVLLAPAWPSGAVGSDLAEADEVFEIAPSAVEKALSTSALILRFAELFNRRHDVMHTLAAWWRANASRRRTIPYLELAQRFAPTWGQLLKAAKQSTTAGVGSFNPLGSVRLDRLREQRTGLLAEQLELVRSMPETDLLSVEKLESLVEAIPGRYAPILPGASIFAQPLDAAGDSWVLNKVTQGTGCFLSRISQILEAPAQKRLVEHLISRSVVEVEGEEAELIEVKYPRNTLVKAHPAQTLRVLDVQGVFSGLPPERLVRLGELRVEADLETETFRVIDKTGRRVLPVQLSTWPLSQLPNRLRLLLMFGPIESRSIFPVPINQEENELVYANRLTCGNLVTRRRTWTVDVERLCVELEGLTGARAYLKVHAWRRRLNLPLVCFYYEKTFQQRFKPQFVDFSSPSLCKLFLASLRKKSQGRLLIEEALPAPEDFPIDGASMTRRAFELYADSLAICPVGVGALPRVLAHDGQVLAVDKSELPSQAAISAVL